MIKTCDIVSGYAEGREPYKRFWAFLYAPFKVIYFIFENSVIKEYDLDNDTYAEEEGKVYNAADNSEWKAVGEKIQITIR